MQDLKPHYLLFTLFIFGVFSANHACNQLDRNSLLSLLLDSSNSTPFNGSSINCCHWEGISCDHNGRVTHLWLPSKDLKGSISPSLGNLTRLSHLNLSHNSLTGLLPTGLFTFLNQLRVLDLSYNYLGGQLPSGIGGCSKLKIFWAGFNSFSGFLPHDIYNAAALEEISFPSNNLSGPISNEIMNLTKLASLELYQNRLSGNLPLNIGKLSKLKQLILHTNSFTDGFQNLRMLDLYDCQLTGQFPKWISKLKNLQILRLGFNRITGSIPGWLSTLPRLSYINLQDNLFLGEFPKKFCGLQAFVSPQAIDDNSSLTMPLYILLQSNNIDFIKSFSYFFGTINLRNNSLSGTIPTEIGCLKRLRNLDLSHNKLKGTIPTQISELTNLEYLDLSTNHLYGEIPVSLINLHFLRIFSVANNNLNGAIPVGTQLQTFDASSFEGNPGLCGYPLPQCSHLTSSKRDEDSQEEEDRRTIPWFHVTMVLGFITGFWGVCAPLVLNKKWRVAYFGFFDKLKDGFYICETRSVFGQIA
ncbi:tyrosine-sulfated glycopeptide receptor 1-like isoform X1 [Carya illinoinensis]|uniref:tyrosine-sulfated glycopeptide receptor 1-like isoform X1 n=1 Tax=Carya illinoinensis TaxID=32201 RepID=UPI001C71D7E6|nr:tyrosine-sulfated glycopeptide receptor 1-like isoform X1 [Carya illinoinensis]